MKKFCLIAAVVFFLLAALNLWLLFTSGNAVNGLAAALTAGLGAYWTVQGVTAG